MNTANFFIKKYPHDKVTPNFSTDSMKRKPAIYAFPCYMAFSRSWCVNPFIPVYTSIKIPRLLFPYRNRAPIAFGIF
jgi:hypothetical protein